MLSYPPDRPSRNFRASKPSICDLYGALQRNSTDFRARKLRKGRSGSIPKAGQLGFPPSDLLLMAITSEECLLPRFSLSLFSQGWPTSLTDQTHRKHVEVQKRGRRGFMCTYNNDSCVVMGRPEKDGTKMFAFQDKYDQATIYGRSMYVKMKHF